MEQKYDFKKLDEETIYQNRRYLDPVVKRLGYTYISEAIYYLYMKLGSFRKAGAKLEVSSGMIRRHCHRCGFPVKGFGGPNNIKVTNEIKEKIYALRHLLQKDIVKTLKVPLSTVRIAFENPRKLNCHEIKYDKTKLCPTGCNHFTKISDYGRCELFDDRLLPNDNNTYMVASKYCLTRYIKVEYDKTQLESTRCREDEIRMRMLD